MKVKITDDVATPSLENEINDLALIMYEEKTND